MELKTRRRCKGEPLQAVFQDIKRLMALAFPGQTGSMAEITTIDAFVEAFNDRVLRKLVLQKNPPTLEEALTCAVRLKVIDESGTAKVPVPFDREGHKKERAYAHVAVSGGIDSQPSSGDDQQSLHDCQRKVDHRKAYAAYGSHRSLAQPLSFRGW